MKKIIFATIVSLYTLLIAFSSNAQKIAVPRAVQESFNQEFKNVAVLQWTPIFDSYIARFSEGQNLREAYFTSDGEYKGIGHHITPSLLPLHIQKKLNAKYSGYEMTELYQFDCEEEGTCFFAVLKNDKVEVIVKMGIYGDLANVKRTKIKHNPANEPMVAIKGKN